MLYTAHAHADGWCFGRAVGISNVLVVGANVSEHS